MKHTPIINVYTRDGAGLLTVRSVIWDNTHSFVEAHLQGIPTERESLVGWPDDLVTWFVNTGIGMGTAESRQTAIDALFAPKTGA